MKKQAAATEGGAYNLTKKKKKKKTSFFRAKSKLQTSQVQSSAMKSSALKSNFNLSKLNTNSNRKISELNVSNRSLGNLMAKASGVRAIFSKRYNKSADIVISPDIIVQKQAKYVALPTGVGHWYEIRDFGSQDAYFYNTLTKQSLWAFPMDILFKPADYDRILREKESSRGWTLCIKSQTFEKFYRCSIKCEVRTRIPREFEVITRTMPYFMGDVELDSELDVNDELVRQSRPALEALRLSEFSSTQVLQILPLKAILQHPIACAAFHRYLCAKFAEENLLFYGACEVFEKGSWMGQTVLGQSLAALAEEGQEQLFQQMQETRASIRIGMQPQKTSKRLLAGVIFGKFVQLESELWICVSDPVATEIEMRLRRVRESSELRGIFSNAKKEVYESMKDSMYPGFIHAAVDGEHVEHFESDELLKVAILDLCRNQVSQ